MNKLFNKAVLNGTTIMGDGLTYPRIPNVYTGDNEGGYQRGDMMDANAVVKMIKELTDTGEITIEELQNLINEEIQERVEGDQDQQRYTDEKIKDLIGTSPETLDTLKEIADALGEDPDFAANVWEKLDSLPEYIVGHTNSSGPNNIFNVSNDSDQIWVGYRCKQIGNSGAYSSAFSLSAATSSAAGVMSASDKKKMNNIPDLLATAVAARQEDPSYIRIDLFRNNLSTGDVSTYPAYILPATSSAAGVMSSSDKVKLDDIEEGAQVNTIESVSVNGTPLEVTDKGVNIPNATTEKDGTMSKADKTKLDSLENYTLPTATDTTLGGVKVPTTLMVVGATVNNQLGITPEGNLGVGYDLMYNSRSKELSLLYFNGTNPSYSTAATVTLTTPNASITENGLMSKEDKAKLDSQPTIKASDATGVTDDDYVVIKKSEYQSILDRLSALENKA